MLTRELISRNRHVGQKDAGHFVRAISISFNFLSHLVELFIFECDHA